MLLTGFGTRDFALLDAFEADEYRHAAVTVATADGDRAAEVYLPVVAIGPDARDWRLEEWTARHKTSMLADMRGSPITNPLIADASPQLSRQHRAML